MEKHWQGSSVRPRRQLAHTRDGRHHCRIRPNTCNGKLDQASPIPTLAEGFALSLQPQHDSPVQHAPTRWEKSPGRSRHRSRRAPPPVPRRHPLDLENFLGVSPFPFAHDSFPEGLCGSLPIRPSTPKAVQPRMNRYGNDLDAKGAYDCERMNRSPQFVSRAPEPPVAPIIPKVQLRLWCSQQRD
jgi:hypothetical protein